MTLTFRIGSGRPQFNLPNGRFDQITKAPLEVAGTESQGKEAVK
jgi:hypothetical protein